MDEVDSILIDEARTPLIISGPAADSPSSTTSSPRIARTLIRDDDYEVDEEKRIVVPTEAGIAKVEPRSASKTSTTCVGQLRSSHDQALRAKELFHRDKDYLVADGEVKIVDEFTGRTLEGRRWSDGLHQAVEAKERVRIREENHTWATVTLQNYFRLYEKLAGMTGTAETEAAEFANTYNMPVVPIPTNEPMVREDHPDFVYKTEGAKFAAVVEDVLERYEKGQPVLIGTASVAKSEQLSRLLEQRGVEHQVLNAKQHVREAEIVAQAGGCTGSRWPRTWQGEGSTSCSGETSRVCAHARCAQGSIRIPKRARRRTRRARPLEKVCARRARDPRVGWTLTCSAWERHESRRIDNQLRGRSGRQGDPGESRFFLSLEDEFMRLFATGPCNG